MKEMIYGTERETEILFEGTYEGYNFFIVSYGIHPCAYVEIPKESKLYLLDYYADELSSIECHGGLTYADNLSHIIGESDKWFIGWDYAHAGDYEGYDVLFGFRSTNKKWTTEEIYAEVQKVINQLKEIDK